MYNKALQHTKYGIEGGGKFFVWVERRCSDDRERSNAHSPRTSLEGPLEALLRSPEAETELPLSELLFRSDTLRFY